MAFEIKIDERGEKYLEDAERHLAFRRDGITGGDLHDELGFELIWNTRKCLMYGREVGHKNDRNVDWHIHFNFIDQDIATNLPVLKNLVTEAFKLYGPALEWGEETGVSNVVFLDAHGNREK